MFSSITHTKLVHNLKRFVKNVRGNTSFTFAIAALPIIAATGSAIDIQRESMTRTTLQAAVDSATLYAATLGTTDNAVLTQKSKPYFELPDIRWENTVTVNSFTMTDNGDHVTGVAKLTQKNWFMGMLGKPTIDIMAKTEVKKSGINLEVSLVLDTTGSMNTGDGSTGNSPIADLRVAADKFINKVMPDTQAGSTFFTKVAIVPYNNAVNPGSSTLAVDARGPVPSGTSTNPGLSNYTFKTNIVETFKTDKNGNLVSRCESGSSIDGYCATTQPITDCVTERIGVEAYTDAPTSSAPVGLAYKNPNSNRNPCGASPVTPLSTNKSALKTSIANLTANYSTAGQVGIAWGWYTLSPRIGLWSGDSQPADYSKLTTTNSVERVRKIMILMTDAEYNSAMCNGVTTGDDPDAYVSPHSNGTRKGSGDERDHIKCAPTNGNPWVQANNMCQGIKQSGVEVYVIGFQLNASYPDRVQLLQNCASDPSHVLNAASQADLDKVFDSLANTLLSMRLSK